jgi:Periplasmic binding protein
MTHARLRVGAVLSLTGRFARFGTQAAEALHVWSGLTADTEVVIEDDAGEPSRVAPALEAMGIRCDLLLGPYSTLLVRAAATFAAVSGHLVWNHGGSGDDVQAAAPGRMVSVLTPTSRYAESFVLHLAERHGTLPLRLVQGRGSFGRQVIAGARSAAERAGIPVTDGENGTREPWALFAAGTFEDDTALVSRVLSGRKRPDVVGTVAAGVREFGISVPDPEGVLGVVQWYPGRPGHVEVGPVESAFLAGYTAAVSAEPDYPAVQAVAAAALAVHCAREAGSTAAEDLWRAAVGMRTSTLFGDFEIDSITGAQRGHRMALVRWDEGRLVALQPP